MMGLSLDTEITAERRQAESNLLLGEIQREW
jgi:hypothetical protein